MIVRFFPLCCFCLLFSSVAEAEIFRWLDDEGNVQFGDRPPPSKMVKRVEVEVNSYESVSVELFEAFNGDSAQKGVRGKKS